MNVCMDVCACENRELDYAKRVDELVLELHLQAYSFIVKINGSVTFAIKAIKG